MTPAPNLRVVKSEPVYIDDLWRHEIRQKGRAHWGALHVAADKREPVLLTMLRRIHRHG